MQFPNSGPIPGIDMLPSSAFERSSKRSRPGNMGGSGAPEAEEFESMLITQWLQSAQTSFASVPGADDDAEAGDEQTKSFALQQLATGIAHAGGFGIAQYVNHALQNSGSKTVDAQERLNIHSHRR